MLIHVCRPPQTIVINKKFKNTNVAGFKYEKQHAYNVLNSNMKMKNEVSVSKKRGRDEEGTK